MKCPIDDTQLAIADRQGVEVDYCPKCRGIWLERGELDKLIERSERYENGERYDGRPHSERDPSDDDDDYDQPRNGDSRRDHLGDQRKRRKKESFLGDLFDF